jgi:diguanylate cyclase (GGDEF)-like protein
MCSFRLYVRTVPTGDPLISLKKYLDMDLQGSASAAMEPDESQSATLESYRAVLRSMGKSAAHACPALGAGLKQNLLGLERRLAADPSPVAVKQTEKQVEIQLQEWGGRTAAHLKARADEVKELLILLARTAESVGDRDHRYTDQFNQLTTQLKTVANLDDLTLIRSSLMQRATDLKTCVDQMARDSQHSVEQLRAEVSNYETKLRAAEHLVLKDALTGLANRRSVEERVQSNIANNQTFSVVMLDLNRFKVVNDTYGHQAGDDLLKQFSAELQSNVRPGDLAGRMGGDEFILLLGSNVEGARCCIQRIQKWVFGKYTIQMGSGKEALSILVDASIGLAEWHPGETMEEVIEQADASMYHDKKKSRR